MEVVWKWLDFPNPVIHLHDNRVSGKRFEEMDVVGQFLYLHDKKKREEEMQSRLDAEQAEQDRIQKERQVKEIEEKYSEWRGQGIVGGLMNVLNEVTLDPAHKGKVKPDLFTEDVPLAIQTLTKGAGEVGRLLASVDFQSDGCDTVALGYFLQEVSGITAGLKDIIYYSHHDTNLTLEKLLEEKKR